MRSLLLALILSLAPQVKVTFFTPDVVRIQKVPEGAFPEGGSLAVTAVPEAVSVTVKTSGGKTVYTSARLRVTVDVNGHVIISLFAYDVFILSPFSLPFPDILTINVTAYQSCFIKRTGFKLLRSFKKMLFSQ